MADKPEDDVEIKRFLPIRVMLVVLTISTLLLGFFSDSILGFAEDVVFDLDNS